MASNYQSVMEKCIGEVNIGMISVQVLASSEMCALLLSNEPLRNNMLRVLIEKLKRYKNDLENQELYQSIWHILIDLKYVAR